MITGINVITHVCLLELYLFLEDLLAINLLDGGDLSPGGDLSLVERAQANPGELGDSNDPAIHTTVALSLHMDIRGVVVHDGVGADSRVVHFAVRETVGCCDGCY